MIIGVAQVVLRKPGQLTIREDLEPFLVRIVGNLQVHGTSADSGYPPLPSEMEPICNICTGWEQAVVP